MKSTGITTDSSESTQKLPPEVKPLPYEVRPVVCDYGIYETSSGNLIQVLNSKSNADLVARILNDDFDGVIYHTPEGIKVIKVDRREFQRGDIVRHFKGGLYMIMDFGMDCTTEKMTVIYRSLSNGMTFTRGYDEFISKTDTVKYPQATQEYRMDIVVLTK